jgi:hypothetical protein
VTTDSRAISGASPEAEGAHRVRRPGEQIEVGDNISHETRGFGSRWYAVHRVTPKFAFVRYNDVAEGKYRRLVSGFGEAEPTQRPQWDTTIRRVWTTAPSVAETPGDSQVTTDSRAMSGASPVDEGAT